MSSCESCLSLAANMLQAIHEDTDNERKRGTRDAQSLVYQRFPYNWWVVGDLQSTSLEHLFGAPLRSFLLLSFFWYCLWDESPLNLPFCVHVPFSCESP
jgi:hypothetical protein